MSERSERMTADCDVLREAAPELVLGTLDGVERARVLAHVGECARCREEIAALADTVNDMALLAPEVDPSAGFTERVLLLGRHEGVRPVQPVDDLADVRDEPPSPVGRTSIQLRPVGGHGAHRRRRVAAALAVAAAVIVLAVGLVARGGSSGTGSVAVAAMVAPDGTVMGDVTRAADGSLSVAVEYPTNWRDYRFEAVRLDGSIDTLGPMTWRDGAWGWRGELPDPATVDLVRIVRPNGVVTCWARLPD